MNDCYERSDTTIRYRYCITMFGYSHVSVLRVEIAMQLFLKLLIEVYDCEFYNSMP